MGLSGLRKPSRKRSECRCKHPAGRAESLFHSIGSSPWAGRFPGKHAIRHVGETGKTCVFAGIVGKDSQNPTTLVVGVRQVDETPIPFTLLMPRTAVCVSPGVARTLMSAYAVNRGELPTPGCSKAVRIAFSAIPRAFWIACFSCERRLISSVDIRTVSCHERLGAYQGTIYRHDGLDAVHIFVSSRERWTGPRVLGSA